MKNEIFEQSHSAEKCERGTLRAFPTYIMFQNIKKMKGDPRTVLYATQKRRKKYYDSVPWEKWYNLVI